MRKINESDISWHKQSSRREWEKQTERVDWLPGMTVINHNQREVGDKFQQNNDEDEDEDDEQDD